MTTEESIYVKKNQQLPDEVTEVFKTLINSDDRDELIRQLRENEWTLEAIANASGITRERVRQISTTSSAGRNLGLDVPEPPLKPERPKPVYIEPTPATLERLLELQPYAQLVRSNGKKYRAEAEEYTKLLNYAHTVEGVTLYRLAKRLGVTHGALRFRLVRYGYKKPVTATSKVYTPILKENRL
jgi:transcriptional regulator with XRE-family HTH domain